MANMSVPTTATNREGLDEYALRWHWVTGPSGSGFTAVLRVKDEARSLPWVLPGVLRSVEVSSAEASSVAPGRGGYPASVVSSSESILSTAARWVRVVRRGRWRPASYW